MVENELHELAHRYMSRERNNHTLQTTALVNEAYLKLVNQKVQWQNRAHFYGIAAQIMRRILIDHARSRLRAKRGGDLQRIPLDTIAPTIAQTPDVLVALDEALERLNALDARQARVVECRFFGGMTEDETAEALGIAVRTMRRDWVKARSWLYRELQMQRFTLAAAAPCRRQHPDERSDDQADQCRHHDRRAHSDSPAPSTGRRRCIM